MSIPVIIIFDVGKTNKKVLLFDENYNLVSEENTQFEETVDDDGFPCENLNALTNWIWQKFWEISLQSEFNVRGVNFSAYGASLVHLNDLYRPFTPLYNYLKPFPEKLKQQFFDTYGGENLIAKQTASPVLGNLNSGLQLYRLKHEKPDIYYQIRFPLHLPQYLSFIISKRVASDVTSVGCHTMLWDFEKHKYHNWVYNENIRTKLAPIFRGDKIVSIMSDHRKLPIGIGLHDSSAALIPYLSSFEEPFVLISTGTWCISLNPFNHTQLTDEELQQDCLSYLSYQGKPVKASRLFAGYEHNNSLKKLSNHFIKGENYYKSIVYSPAIFQKLQLDKSFLENSEKTIRFAERDLSEYLSYEEAYHQLIADIVRQQKISTNLVLRETPVKSIFVDGGFSTNDLFMQMLSHAYSGLEVKAATLGHASALGAALAIHTHWNKNEIPKELITMKNYSKEV